MTRQGLVAGAVVLALVAAVAAALLLSRLPEDRFVAGPQPTLPIPTRSVAPTPTPEADPCRGGADRPFTPASIEVAGQAHPVMELPRDARGVPGVPPLTDEGKRTWGWDGSPSPLPGARRGHVLVNAHTYPDGSALGNLLLDRLEDGDVLVVRGEGQVQCYAVERELEVPADSRDSGYESPRGPARLAILACSGTRTGPGEWSHRTIWFAKAVDATPRSAARPAPPSTAGR